jgi:hypothetical protein
MFTIEEREFIYNSKPVIPDLSLLSRLKISNSGFFH